VGGRGRSGWGARNAQFLRDGEVLSLDLREPRLESL